MPRVYLAGPIDGMHYKDANNWREYVERQLNISGIESLTPMRGKEHLENTDRISPTGKELFSTPSGITTRDRLDVMRSDVIFINMNRDKGVSVGTIIELGWADAWRKPVVMCVPEEDYLRSHNMVQEIVGYFVEDLDTGIEVVRSLLNCTNKRGYKDLSLLKE